MSLIIKQIVFTCVIRKFLIINFLFLILLMSLKIDGRELCPSVCVCKWKGGKQTVECIDRLLYTIPENMDQSTQVLDMSGNNIQILPGETFLKTELTNLQKVYLRNCNLGQIDDEAFKGLSNLIELDLSHNLLTSVPSATLVEIPSLRELILTGNPIQKIDNNAFRPVPGLIKLDLSHCELQAIATKAFEGLELLQFLRLNGNKLSELQSRTIETLSGLHGIELHDNPWLCDCRLRATKLWLTENNIPPVVDPICSGGPERVIERRISELNIDDFACKPQMLPMSRYIDATTGENATIICKTSAVPAAAVNWYWNGRLLVNNSAFSSYQKVFIFETGQFEKQSRLVLTNAQETDSSEFYCVSENRAGTAEANFTLHVVMPIAGMATLGSGQIAGLSIALVTVILFILLVILFLLVRLRRIPFSESKTPGQLEVITSVSPQNNSIGKIICANQNDTNSLDRKNHQNDVKCANPVQKPPRLTDLPYSTNHYDGNGSILSTVPGYLSPTASAENNPDLINDTRKLGSSGELNGFGLDSTNGTGGKLDCDPLERPGSGEYIRAGCDSLYPSGLWEITPNNLPPCTNASNKNTGGQPDFYLKRANSTTLPGYNYSDKTPIIDSTNLNIDDEHTSEFLNRTFPRTGNDHHHHHNSNSSNPQSGYPTDYGLPIVPGAEQNKTRDILPPPGMPTNAKTIRVWQRGGVPVLPPVTALKRALKNSRNSPDEGYQEGCGTDV